MSMIDFISSNNPWLRVRHSPWFLVCIAWIYLTFTQCGELLWFDSGELALAGHSFGLAHPPGQPFYAFLSALSALLPNPLWCLNQLSALALALSLYPLSIIYISLNGFGDSQACLWMHDNKPSEHCESTELKDQTECKRFELDLGFFIITLIWLSLYPVWDQGTRIEVYALANLLGFSSLALLSHRLTSQDKPYLWWAGVCLGLCGATQAIFAVAFGLSSLILLYQIYKFSSHVNIVKYVLGVVLGFTLPHLYIYWAIEYSDGFVWGNWSSWADVLHYFGGADYVQNEHTWTNVPQNMMTWFSWFISFGGLAWMLITGLAIFKTLFNRLNYWFFCLFSAAGVFPLTYQVYWPEIPDFSAYLLPCLTLSLLMVWQFYSQLAQQSHRLLLVIFLIIGSLWNASPITQRTRIGHHLPLTMAQDWLNSLPQNAMLFVESDHWVFPLMYAQYQLKVRSDVLVFNVGFARSSWYWRWLKKQHPTVPSLKELTVLKSQRTRLANLALTRTHVYTESSSLAMNLSLQMPLLQSQPCPSSWGFNVSCQSPLPLPKTERLRAWATHPAHQDPMTQKVLARLGLSTMQSLWSLHKTNKALDFAMAALGQKFIIVEQKNIPWWPVPNQVWQAAQVGLIGSPEALESLVHSLSKSN